jgi:hypothetical protein
MKATAWVRRALQELGEDASPSAVRQYIQSHAPEVPAGHVSLALRSIRMRAPRTSESDESLFKQEDRSDS